MLSWNFKSVLALLWNLLTCKTSQNCIWGQQQQECVFCYFPQSVWACAQLSGDGCPVHGCLSEKHCYNCQCYITHCVGFFHMLKTTCSLRPQAAFLCCDVRKDRNRISFWSSSHTEWKWSLCDSCWKPNQGSLAVPSSELCLGFVFCVVFFFT